MSGYKIKELREARGMSRTELANAIGVPRATLGMWERGDCMFTISQACDIADALDCTLDELAGRNVEYASISIEDMDESKQREVQRYADYIRQREDS